MNEHSIKRVIQYLILSGKAQLDFAKMRQERGKNKSFAPAKNDGIGFYPLAAHGYNDDESVSFFDPNHFFKVTYKKDKEKITCSLEGQFPNIIYRVKNKTLSICFAETYLTTITFNEEGKAKLHINLQDLPENTDWKTLSFYLQIP